MSIDDFVLPTSLASPIGLSPLPPETHEPIRPTKPSTAIPIKGRKDPPPEPHPAFPPSAPPQETLRNLEFDYVRRRVRKTSIDETRVCRND